MSADVEQKDSGKGKKGKQKKMKTRVDFTPMVDMNMLLITFFMLCTSLSKPQTMEISMPTNDKVDESQQTKVKASQAVTLILGEKDKVYYYLGEFKAGDNSLLQATSYTATGIRDLLLSKNRSIVAKVNDLKQQKKNLKISAEECAAKIAEAKEEKGSPTVIIKAADKSTYKNLIDALDEMQICCISKYVIVPITDGEKALLASAQGAK
ncbi:outer membrane transport energization protein ExbD [Bacteroides luti]|jgi:biopolymer transport protein ExbD|uniref:Outer membrane transport energization protein ExbD n=1 Tax=Bacteroides luti TaxID=1297750 RepID=A0A1M5EXN8_9BACE|nr:biopolymer transporter ExbD [Bacteroides luti]SHF83896.1 outer membrane transport energization protein ExbD [Bacteroides luti]